MNKGQFTKNIGDRFRLRERPYRLDGSQIDDDWTLAEISDRVRLRNARTNGELVLGFDHIQKFTTDPQRGVEFAFLLLDVHVIEQPGGSFIYEPIVRGGTGQGPSIFRLASTASAPVPLTWLDLETRFKELRQQELADARSGSDRLVSALTYAEPGEPKQWRLMGGSKDTRADTNRLCRIAGAKLGDAKWQRVEADDFDRWLQFVVEVGGHTRHLHSTSSGGEGPSIERDDYWIRDLVTECLGALREALAQDETGNYPKPPIQAPTVTGTSLTVKHGPFLPVDRPIAVSLQAGTARMGPFGRATTPTVDLMVVNEGAPFLLVVRGQIIRASDGLEWMPSDEWEYEPRQIKGGGGRSWFHVATLEHDRAVSGQRIVGVRAEQMVVVRLWEGTGEMCFEIEWSFFREIDSTLHQIKKASGLFTLTQDRNGFEWELTQ